MRPDVAELINNLATIKDYTVFSGVYGWMPGDGLDTTSDDNEYVSMYEVRIRCAPRRFDQ
jgi:hypothetical protein